ncbi:MAG: hypothetical protein RIS36_316 [Pseudomonadota bacterium]|jgi:hypothetical protein
MSAEAGNNTSQIPVEPPLQTVFAPSNSAPSKTVRQGSPFARLGLTALVLFLGYKALPFYYYYFDIKNNCAQVLRNAAVRSDEELRREWLEVIRGHGIEKDARDIGIQRIGGRVKMWLHYQEILDVSLFGRSVTLYSFDFTPSADVGVEE